MADVVVLVPVLARPHRVQPLLESIDAATTSPWRAVFIVDPGDTAERRAVRAAGADMLICGGSYARKINEATRHTTEPLLFFGADDLRFHSGWLPAAAALVSESVGVIGTQDLGNPRVIAGEHATHSLVTRAYTARGTIDRRDRVLHEGYRHNFVDDEFVGTARARGAWAFAADSVVEHLHPNWDRSVDRDATYRRGQQHFARDQRHFNSRRRLWT